MSASATSAFVDALFPRETEYPATASAVLFELPGKAMHAFSPDDHEGLLAKTDALTASGQNVYVHVALHDRAKMNGRGSAESAAALTGLFDDLDVLLSGHRHKGTALPNTIEEARGFLAEMPWPPSLIVHSGFGLQPWWLFREPLLLGNPDDKAMAEALLARYKQHRDVVAAAHGWAFDAVHDFARILRAVPSRNFKNPDAIREVTLLEANDLRYNPTELLDALPPLKVKEDFPSTGPVLVGEARTAQAQGLAKAAQRRALEIGRNPAGFWLACQLRDAGLTAAEATAEGADYVAFVDQSWPDRDYGLRQEYAESIRQAFGRKARAPLPNKPKDDDAPKPYRWSGPYDPVSIVERSNAGGPRFRTGIETLDERLTLATQPTKVGTPLGRIIGFTGAPSAGKSMLLDQTALGFARQGLRAVMLVLDEPDSDAAERIGQGLGLMHSELNAENPRATADFRRKASGLDIEIVPNEEVDEAEPTIEDAAEYLFSVPNETGYVLAVDSAHRVYSRTARDGDDQRTRIRRNLGAFRDLTREHRDLLVTYTAEVNRGAYAAKDKSMRTSAVAAAAEGRDFEYASNAMFFLTCEGDSDIVNVEIPKNKIGRKRKPFSLRRHEGSASFGTISDEAVEAEEEGKKEEALLPIVDAVVAWLTKQNGWRSAQAIEDEDVGPQKAVRAAIKYAFKAEKIARMPNPKRRGYLYRVDVSGGAA